MKKILLVSIAILLTSSSFAQWVQTDTCTPSGIQFRDIAVSGSKIFEGDDFGDVYFSNNYGNTWSKVINGLTGAAVYSLATKGTLTFAGTNGSGMFITANDGLNWSAINSGLPVFGPPFSAPSIFINDILIDGSNIFVGTQEGVYLSTNDGPSWTAANTGLPAGQSSMAIARNGSYLFTSMTSGFGMYVSNNDGASWTAANTGLPVSLINCIVSKGSAVYAGDQTNGVYKSTDNGATWSSSNTGITGTNSRSLAVVGSYLFFGTSNNIYISSDDGMNWNSVNDGMPGDGVSAINFCSPYVLAGCEFAGGVWIRTIPDLVTGLAEIKDIARGTVSPNPFSTNSILSIDEIIEVKDGRLRIIDVTGRTVSTIESIQTNQIEIKRGDLPGGIYFYELNVNQDLIKGKFTIH